MPVWPDATEAAAMHARSCVAASACSLPFRGQSWRGTSGAWSGLGLGNSIDFQDHRSYLPGDDPRYIDWSVYARTGNYTMKLYREEVSPRIEIAMDVSASMFADPMKSARSVELLYFCVESALRSGSACVCYAISGRRAMRWPVEAILGYASPDVASESAEAAGPPDLSLVPWHQGALRVLISDLLYPGSPERMLSALAAQHGRGVILAPWSSSEESPDWDGNVELHDCEAGDVRVQNVNPDLLQRYRAAYQRHFNLWTGAAQRHAVRVARVGSHLGLAEALMADAFSTGAIEPVR